MIHNEQLRCPLEEGLAAKSRIAGGDGGGALGTPRIVPSLEVLVQGSSPKKAKMATGEELVEARLCRELPWEGEQVPCARKNSCVMIEPMGPRCEFGIQGTEVEVHCGQGCSRREGLA